ncbi:DUF6220 domain-containing protein [Actinomadura sp. HBU206391]|uniref:DUF6220 domain-containing protein n=1 Tax=Actinomadura sp. HBU206391 TaxID=2731692 RepID=UPI00164F00C1|nr:DUF6220 domain-containing protein [Actinomadura sp. HBU206391]MBC6463247.1 hypothetical protein [Actinomadura sp. HBU206391]
MRKVFAALAAVLMLAVAVQFFLAAMGSFDTAPKDESFQPHRAMGNGILLFAVALTLFAAVARLPGRLIGMTGLVAGLILLQSVIQELANAFGDSSGSTSTAGELVFGLHAVNGLLIATVGGRIFLRARELASSGAPAETAPGSGARTTERTS